MLRYLIALFLPLLACFTQHASAVQLAPPQDDRQESSECQSGTAGPKWFPRSPATWEPLVADGRTLAGITDRLVEYGDNTIVLEVANNSALTLDVDFDVSVSGIVPQPARGHLTVDPGRHASSTAAIGAPMDFCPPMRQVTFSNAQLGSLEPDDTWPDADGSQFEFSSDTARQHEARASLQAVAMSDDDPVTGPGSDGIGADLVLPPSEPDPTPPCETVLLPTFPVEVPACVPPGTDVPTAETDDGQSLRSADSGDGMDDDHPEESSGAP